MAAIAAPVDAETAASPTKTVIGATADVTETGSGLTFLARIDTGAQSCSLHAEKIEIEGADERMTRNVDKPVRVLLRNFQGDQHWVETRIADTVRVKTSDGKERRYKVWLTLRHGGVERNVHVTLNDRSHMTYPLLIGRNFLAEHFVVDVALKHSPDEGVDGS